MVSKDADFKCLVFDFLLYHIPKIRSLTPEEKLKAGSRSVSIGKGSTSSYTSVDKSLKVSYSFSAG